MKTQGDFICNFFSSTLVVGKDAYMISEHSTSFCTCVGAVGLTYPYARGKIDNYTIFTEDDGHEHIHFFPLTNIFIQKKMNIKWEGVLKREIILIICFNKFMFHCTT